MGGTRKVRPALPDEAKAVRLAAELLARMPDARSQHAIAWLRNRALAGIQRKARIDFKSRSVPEPMGLAQVKAAVDALGRNPRTLKAITRRGLNKAVREWLDNHHRPALSVATVARCLAKLNENLPAHWSR